MESVSQIRLWILQEGCNIWPVARTTRHTASRRTSDAEKHKPRANKAPKQTSLYEGPPPGGCGCSQVLSSRWCSPAIPQHVACLWSRLRALPRRGITGGGFCAVMSFLCGEIQSQRSAVSWALSPSDPTRFGFTTFIEPKSAVYLSEIRYSWRFGSTGDDSYTTS